jgi:hypothetical protein
MEVALRRRLEGVETVAISQAQQTAVVTFDGAPHTFAAQEFRAAVAEADVEVLHFEIDACGTVEVAGVTRWFIAGPNRFALAGQTLDGVTTTCLTAGLDDRSQPYALDDVRQLTNEEP